MSRRHLSIGSNARLELSARVWNRLIEKMNGHIQIGSGAEVKIHDTDNPKKEPENEALVREKESV